MPEMGVRRRLGNRFRSRGQPRGLYRQEHDSIAEGTANKSIVLIEANRILIYGMSNDCSNTGDLRHLEASPHAIAQQIRSQTFTLVLSIDGQPTNEQERHLIWHCPPKLRRRQRYSLFHRC
jgi:hypothetical protein